MLLAVDRSNVELTETILEMRRSVPEYAYLTDDQIMDRLETLIARIPKKCPECDGFND